MTDWLPKVVDRLVAQVAGMTTDRVFPSAFGVEDHLRFPPADRFVTLFTPRFTPDQRAVEGGGAVNTPLDAALTVTAYVRLEADLENRSVQALTEATLGVYPILQQILTALQTWEGPEDSTGSLLLFRYPMRLAAAFDIMPKSGANNSRWSVAPMPFVVPFVADLGLPYP